LGYKGTVNKRESRLVGSESRGPRDNSSWGRGSSKISVKVRSQQRTSELSGLKRKCSSEPRPNQMRDAGADARGASCSTVPWTGRGSKNEREGPFAIGEAEVMNGLLEVIQKGAELC